MRALSKNNFVSIGVLLFLLLIISGCSFLPSEEEVLAPPLAEPPQLEYQTVEVTRGEIVSSLTGVGSLVPTHNIDLHYTENGGRLNEIHVNEGDKVEQGQVLAELDTGNLAFEIQQQKLELEKAELRLEQTKENNADKYTIKIGELDVQGIRNQLNLLNQQMNKARIISPIDGVVTFVSELAQGDPVTAYESILKVAETNELQLQYLAANAVQLSPITLGMEAVILLDDQELSAEVVQIPNSVPTDISSQNPDFYQKLILMNVEELPEDVNLGDSIDFEIIIAENDDTLIIPKTALRTFSGRSYVQVVTDDIRREIDIETGIENSREVEVLEGLDEGDTLIVR